MGLKRTCWRCSGVGLWVKPSGLKLITCHLCDGTGEVTPGPLSFLNRRGKELELLQKIETDWLADNLAMGAFDQDDKIV